MHSLCRSFVPLSYWCEEAFWLSDLLWKPVGCLGSAPGLWAEGYRFWTTCGRARGDAPLVTVPTIPSQSECEAQWGHEALGRGDVYSDRRTWNHKAFRAEGASEQCKAGERLGERLVIYDFIGFWHCRCYFCRKTSQKSCDMKPENAHIVSLCGLLVLLVVFFGVQWGLMVQDGGRPGNMTLIWAVRVKEPGMGRRSGGNRGWPWGDARWGIPPHPVTSGELSSLTK